jgi:hypothetical protein
MDSWHFPAPIRFNKMTVASAKTANGAPLNGENSIVGFGIALGLTFLLGETPTPGIRLAQPEMLRE